MDHYQVNVTLANEKKLQIKNKLLDEQATIDNIKPGLYQTHIVHRPTLNLFPQCHVCPLKRYY